ncbi:MAG TPA: AMP-binding protein [Microlunatus sp.]|nr:AMP-binding protein [Microlunatus sp.]
MVGREPEQAADQNPGDGPETVGSIAATANLSDLVTEQAIRHPDRSAIVEPGVRAVTWAALDASIRAVAAGLGDRGLVAGQRVGLDGHNSIAWVVGYLAALRAGLVVVPTDPGASTADRDVVLADTGARAVLTTRAADLGDRIPALDLSEQGLRDLAAPTSPVASPPDDESLAVLAITQGTSADPQIVMLSHRALLAHQRQVRGYAIVDEQSVVLGVLPFFHAYGLNAVLGTCLAAGARLVIPGTDTRDLLTVIETEQVDNLPLTPGLLYRLAHADGVADRLRGVRTVVVGGAPLPWRLGKRFTELTGLRVERGYGLTEASPGVTSTVGGPILGPFHVGRPLPGVEVRIGDGLDPSEPGEIAIRGANLFSGYWPDGAGGPDTDGWFATGDIGYLADGELFLVDRTREVISVSGFTVYPSEVEQLIRQLPEVEAVAVVARSAGAGGGLVAFVSGPSVTTELVGDFVRTRVPAFKRPREIRVVDDLPRGVTGVIRRSQLRRQLEQESVG